jgi:tRNA A-37 threonylcarbamoyl transferase component Bud32
LKKNDAPQIDLVKQIVNESLHSTVYNIERVLSGSSTYVYRIQVSEDTFYVRILPENNLSFGMEVTVHSLVRQKKVHVPEVIYFEHHNEALGMSMMIVKEIPGSNVKDCSSIDAYADILYEAGKQIAVVNQVRADGFGWLKTGKEENGTTLRGEKNSLQEYIYEFLEEDLSLLSNNIFNKSDTSQIGNLINTGTQLMSRHESSLVHGDFDDTHIFHKGGRYTGIIDFGEIQGNSPLYDLGHYKLHEGQSNSFHGFNFLVKGYKEFADLSFDDQLEIDLWALWIGVRRLGRIYNRTWGKYHEHLIKTVKDQIETLNRRL